MIKLATILGTTSEPSIPTDYPDTNTLPSPPTSIKPITSPSPSPQHQTSVGSRVLPTSEGGGKIPKVKIPPKSDEAFDASFKSIVVKDSPRPQPHHKPMIKNPSLQVNLHNLLHNLRYC